MSTLVGCSIKLTMVAVLRNGIPVLIRPISPSDKAELSAGLHRLSPSSTYQRFLSAKPTFSAAELRYLTEVDGRDHAAFVAEEVARPGRIVAVGRYVRLTEEPGTAEAAIVVADHLHRLGLGSLLAESIARTAAKHGIGRFTATMLSDNVPAHRLMGHLTRHLERPSRASGTEELIVDLAA